MLNRLIPRGLFSHKSNILAAEFLVLKPISVYKDIINGNNIGLVVTLDDGTINIFDISGKLLIKHDLGYSTRLLACTGNYDEIKIAVITPENKLEIYLMTMDRIKANQTGEIERIPDIITFELKLENKEELFRDIKPTAIIFYVKTGKKT